jgi:hypothetical protein
MIAILITILVFTLNVFTRKQKYQQLVADYTQFASASDLQADLSQKLKAGLSTEATVISFIIQSGITSTISLDSNCSRRESQATTIFCKVRAPAADYSNESWMRQLIHKLSLEYYLIDFVFESGKLKEIEVYPYTDTGFAL